VWRPPASRKHALPLLAAPSVEAARAARWFQPIRVGALDLETRTWVPAMVPWRASDEGFVTDRVLAWYERFAQGKPGALVVEATGIRDVPSGPLLRIGHDRFIAGLRELASVVRRASEGETRLFIQLIDFLSIRRRPTRERFLGQFLEITARHRAFTGERDERLVREALLRLDDAELREVLTPREREALDFGARERVTDTHLPYVRELPQVLPSLFAAAAERAERAGFDGVELHYAHAYTMASFLSARNDRSDGYGGSREARVRLPLEVYRAVRARVGERFVVGARFLSDEIIAGGSDVADACAYAEAFASAGMDFLSLSRGGKFEDAKQPKLGQAAYPYTGPSGWECMPTVHADERGPFGRNVHDAARIRAHVREAGFETPLVVSGGVAGFEQAEDILSRGAADIVGAARQTLADPDWFQKLRAGRGAEIRRCAFTNYCEGLDQMHKPVTCKLWDRTDLTETGVDLHEGRRLVAPPWA
jgi:2,4-dienoyl-CoA reductase-like NADH-dependent reductase (Old Yellow Enzyme family)